MRVLSFDIGIRNLAWFDVTFIKDRCEHHHNIHDFGIIDLRLYTEQGNKIHPGIIVKALFDSGFSDIKWDVILLENQPVRKNPSMKSIQCVIHSFFETLQIHMQSAFVIKNVNPMNKLGSNMKTTYTERKKKSVEMTYDILQSDAYIESINKLNAFKKKDDICDAFLQYNWFVNQYKQT